MTRRVSPAIALASFAGLLAAAPVVLAFVVGGSWIDESSVWLLLPFLALCPPWWFFWSVLGRPEDLSYLVQLGGLVLLFNAFLYAPVGALHAALWRFRPFGRRLFVGVVLVSLLALGHAFFMAEPAFFTAFLNRVAT